MRTFHILDNGGRPFKIIDNTAHKSLTIHTKYYDAATDTNLYNTAPALTLKYTTLFVGKSPKNAMTTFSGGDCPRFHGNTLLAHISGNKYVAISSEIFEFTTDAPIISYTSPVGNSSVPYPYATDSSGGIYLILECVKITPTNLYHMTKSDDPYRYYYNVHNITDTYRKPKQFTNYKGITALFLGKEEYIFSCPIDPASDYERVTNDPELGEMSITYIDHPARKPTSKATYCEICNEYNKMMGFTPFSDYIVLIPRQI